MPLPSMNRIHKLRDSEDRVLAARCVRIMERYKRIKKARAAKKKDNLINGFDAELEKYCQRIRALTDYIVVDCEHEHLTHNLELRKMFHPQHGRKKIVNGKAVLSEISIGVVKNRRLSHILRYVIAQQMTPKSETLYGIDFETDLKTLMKILPPMVEGLPIVAYQNESEVRALGQLGCKPGKHHDLVKVFRRINENGNSMTPKLKHLAKLHGIVGEDDDAQFHNSANDVYFQYELVRRIQDGTSTHFL